MQQNTAVSSISVKLRPNFHNHYKFLIISVTTWQINPRTIINILNRVWYDENPKNPTQPIDTLRLFNCFICLCASPENIWQLNFAENSESYNNILSMWSVNIHIYDHLFQCCVIRPAIFVRWKVAIFFHWYWDVSIYLETSKDTLHLYYCVGRGGYEQLFILYYYDGFLIIV